MAIKRRFSLPVIFVAFGIIATVFFALVIGIPTGISAILSNNTKDTAIVTIEDKERVANSYYLVWTEVHNEDGTKSTESFTVKDDLFQGKFNASDTYGQLKEGKTYEVSVNGFRNGFFSSYRNILSVDGVVDIS